MRPDNSPSARDDTADAVLDMAVRNGTAELVIKEVKRQLRQRQRRAFLLSAAGLAVLAAGLWRLTPPPATDLPAPNASNAVVSVPAKRVLPDGTIVDLKDGAQITFDYSGSLRRVTLHEGEAHFAVAKNPQRVFVVEAAGVEVRAVGTAFAVQRGPAAVEVIVTEGRVAITTDNTVNPAAPETSTLVDSGNRCVVELTTSDTSAFTTRVASVDQRELGERLAWRVPRLEFSGTPLAQAIPLFNRHAGVRLVLGDSTLGTLELSGVVRADNTDSLLRLLEAEFGIVATERRSEIVLQTAR